MENTLLVKFQNQHTLQLATQITLERGGVVDRVYTFFPFVWHLLERKTPLKDKPR